MHGARMAHVSRLGQKLLLSYCGATLDGYYTGFLGRLLLFYFTSLDFLNLGIADLLTVFSLILKPFSESVIIMGQLLKDNF